LDETKTASLGSGETEPVPKGSARDGARTQRVRRYLCSIKEVSVDANFLILGIPNIDTRYLVSIDALLLDRESGSSVTASSESLKIQIYCANFLIETALDISYFLRLYISILCSLLQSLVDINLPVIA